MEEILQTDFSGKQKLKTPLKIKILVGVIFLLAVVILNSIVHLQTLNREESEKMKASYTAEETVRRIESQLNQYMAKSDLLRNMIEAGYELNEADFSALAKLLMDEDEVLEAIEMAEDGKVSMVYPYAGNEEAYGLDMFANPVRQAYANLAKESGKYTIAGPFELVQGGMGALLFDPVYITDRKGEETFWGFSILVLNWDKFMDSIALDKLEGASYCYRIWRKDLASGEPMTIAQGKENGLKNALEVVCDAPNDTWMIDIVPVEGWYSRTQLMVDSLLCIGLAVLIALVFGQFALRRYRDGIYTEQIRKTAEQAKAANAAKSAFLSRMTHDIRTPLNGIMGLLEIDEKHPDDVELITANRKKIFVSANHLLSLINDVLQMSKLEDDKVELAHEVINLQELAKDILTIMEQRATEAGITMEYDQSVEDIVYPCVYGSPVHIRQLFLNIYGNCIKYNRAGGKVTTHFECLGEQAGKVIYRWTIADTGIGMSQEFLNHIFEPFVQERSDARSIYNGTGLGMAIVKRFVDRMEGTIEVTSVKGEGSTFIVTLPFEIAEEKKTRPVVEEENADIHGLHLLLAEDNDLNAEIAETLLEDEGAEVTVAKDGKQAVETFLQNPPGSFDVILMDIMMPVMDGITATKIIRQSDKADARTIPIIAMTANAFDEDARTCLEAGMNAHLPKPFQMQKVVETIAAFVPSTKMAKKYQKSTEKSGQ